MSRRKTQSTTISLFPFLAVLICTMGALILLLIVTTRQIRAQEVARAQAQLLANAERRKDTGSQLSPAKPIPDPEREKRNEEARRREAEIAEQAGKRERLQAELNQERDRLEDAKREFESLQAKLDGMREKLNSEQSERAEVRRQKSELSEEERKLLDDLEHARRKLMELQARLENAQGEFALVPFDGKSGTTRRPIFVECTERGFRILPEDILLTPEDMNGFSERVNPLLAGTEALTAYWSGRGDVFPAEVDRKNPPYILLIVRPSGTVAYYLARRFLSRMKEPFGYELIEEDFPLHVPAGDPQAKRVAQQAIELTLASRNEILEELANRKLQSRDIVEVKTLNNDVHTREELAKVEEMLPNRGVRGRAIAPPISEKNGQEGVKGSVTEGGGSVRNLTREESPVGGREGKERGGNGAEANGKYARFADLQPTDSENHAADSGQGEFKQGGSYAEELMVEEKRGGTWDESPGEGTRKERTQRGGEFRPVSRARTKPAGESAQGSGAEASTDQERGSPETDRRKSSPRDSDPQENTAQGTANGGRVQRDASQEVEQVVPDRARPPALRKAVPASAVPRSIAPRTRWGGNSGAGIGMQKKIQVDVEEERIIIEQELEIPLLEGESREMLARRLLGGIDWAASQWGEPHKNYYWIPVVRFRVHPGCLGQQARMQGVLQEWGVSSTVEFLKPSQVRK